MIIMKIIKQNFEFSLKTNFPHQIKQESSFIPHKSLIATLFSRLSVIWMVNYILNVNVGWLENERKI